MCNSVRARKGGVGTVDVFGPYLVEMNERVDGRQEKALEFTVDLSWGLLKRTNKLVLNSFSD